MNEGASSLAEARAIDASEEIIDSEALESLRSLLVGGVISSVESDDPSVLVLTLEGAAIRSLGLVASLHGLLQIYVESREGS